MSKKNINNIDCARELLCDKFEVEFLNKKLSSTNDYAI